MNSELVIDLVETTWCNKKIILD